MDVSTMILLAVVLFLAILVPYLVFEIRRGKARGHLPWTRRKPLGHSDVGDDTGRGPGGSTRAPRGTRTEGMTYDDDEARPGS